MESVFAHLQYLLWCCAILNIFCANVAINFETHDKNVKLIHNMFLSPSVSCLCETDFDSVDWFRGLLKMYNDKFMQFLCWFKAILTVK